MGIQASLRAPQLIPRTLKLITMQASSGYHTTGLEPETKKNKFFNPKLLPLAISQMIHTIISSNLN